MTITVSSVVASRGSRTSRFLPAVPLACQIERALTVASGQPRSPSFTPRTGPPSLYQLECIPRICLIRMRSQVQVLAGPPPHRRRSERCRQRAGRARCRLGPRWGRTPIPAGTSSGPSGAAHPGVRLGHDHPPWSRPQPEDGSHAACGHLARRLLPCPPRSSPRRRGPPPTRRPGSATDLPLTNATAAASPASRPPGPSSSRRRPGSHRGLQRFRWSGSPGHLDLVPNATA
jgi:hypothetical protein